MYKKIFSILFVAFISTISLFSQSGTLSFAQHVIDDDHQSSSSSWAVDLDNDGDVDIVAGSYNDQLYWYENNGLQEFTQHVISSDLNGIYDVKVSDFDNDGDNDIWGFSSADAATYFFENDGSQNFTKTPTLTLFGEAQIFTADINGDGKLNLVKFDNPITWYEGNGSGTFVTHSITTVPNTKTYFLGDLDGDRDADWVVRDTLTNTTHTIINDRSGVNTKSVNPITFEYVDFTYFGAHKDIDSDGDIDLLGFSIQQKEVYWYENDGTFNFTRHIIDSSVVYPWAITAADLNNDNSLEIILSDNHAGTVVSYENDGNQNFTKTTLGTIYTPLGHFLSDIDNDSDIDVVVNSNYGNSLAWFENLLFTKNTGDHVYQTPNLGNHNYVYTIAPQKAMTTLDSVTLNKDAIENVQYVDGLGRPMQTVAIRAGGKGEDLITKIAYDAYGRQTKDYLPYAESSNTGEKYRTSIDLNGYYKQKYAADFDNTTTANINPYSEKHYEASPLNRVVEQGAPGDSWKLNTSANTDHTIKFDYQTNIANEVRLFEVTFNDPNNTEAPSLIENGHYAAGELYKTITKDENWQPGQTHDKDHTTEEFKDKQGRVVLKRTYNLNAPHDTYYVYDDYGNLSYVLSPKASDQTTIDQSILNELCYQYKYDYRNRLIEKKIPGKGWESIVYDKLDRPILTTDANLAPDGKWLFTKYDVLGRVVYAGIFSTTNTLTRSDLQTQVNNAPLYQFEERQAAQNTIGGTTHYYTSRTFPNIGIEILTINYYDDYVPFDPAINPQTVFGVQTTTLTKGLATGTKVKVLDVSPEAWITTITYYDDKARPIYVYAQNDYLNTIDIVKNQLDFTGRALKVRTGHTYGSNPELVTLDTFTYDQAGRVLKQVQCIGGSDLEDDCGAYGAEGIQNTLVTTETVSPGISKAIEASGSIELNPGFEASPLPGQTVEIEIKQGSISGSQAELIAENTYDELGQLISKKVGNVESTPLQEVDYNYNVRGWLTSINNVDNIGNDLFSFKINYNTITNPINPSNPLEELYNGNISQTFWKTANIDASLKQYDYNYDALNRLKSGEDNSVNAKFSVGITGYDKNGNIQGIFRQGQVVENPDINNASDFGLMDYISYAYDAGNKLLSVTEQSGGNITYGFKDGNTVGNDYAYDANGNMIQDLNKGIAANGISYNHLNLPTQVTINGQNIDYIYDASGVKLQKTVNGTTTAYASNYIYENNNLQFFNHPEGYITPNNANGYDYIYQYKDHLGNIRLSYTDSDGNGEISASAEIIEENNYYPFGLKHKGYNDGGATSLGNNAAQKFKYNGKELNEELGLNWYDYGARNHEASLGRWMNLDPLAARYDSYSPYNFTINNPIYFVDPDGKRIIIYYQSGGQEKQYEYNYEKDRNIDDLPEFLANALTALDGLYESSNIDIDGDGESDTNPLDVLIESDKELSIVSGKVTTFKKGKSKRSANKRTIREKYSDIGTLYFDDKNGVLFDDVNDTKGKVLKELFENNNLPPTAKVNSPMSVLGHDILHAFNFLTDKKAQRARRNNISTRNETPYFRNAEEKHTTTLSIQINRNLGENDRKNYRGTPVKTRGVKSNKIKKE